jgi:hypothetical protein
MKLYSITITAHVDDLDTLDVHLDAQLDIASVELQSIALTVLPAHLRKVARDLENE